MSILIKGMEMPNDGMKNIMILADGRVFQFSGYGNPEPLGTAVPVHEPHGRLIDADTMIASIKRQTGFLKIMGGDLATVAEILEKGILQEIENAPTIIPAEEEE